MESTCRKRKNKKRISKRKSVQQMGAFSIGLNVYACRGIYHENERKQNETIFCSVSFPIFYTRNIKDASTQNRNNPKIQKHIQNRPYGVLVFPCDKLHSQERKTPYKRFWVCFDGVIVSILTAPPPLQHKRLDSFSLHNRSDVKDGNRRKRSNPDKRMPPP